MADFADSFLFEVEGISQALRVARFTGREGLSELFRFDVLVVCDDGSVSFDAAVEAPALLTMRTAGEPRYAHGIVARFEQGDYGAKLTSYLFTVVPRAWRLEHRHDCRIFQQKTAPEIIQAVLEGAGLASGTDFRLSLQGTYKAREYCVQHRESDWAFVQRLMEEEGICNSTPGGGGSNELRFEDNSITAALVLSLSCTLLGAACLQSPTSDTDPAEAHSPNGGEQAGKAQQEASGALFMPRDFTFVIEHEWDGQDKAGGWQIAYHTPPGTRPESTERLSTPGNAA